MRWNGRERFVSVACPDCGERRYDSAKSVAFRVRRDRFTGRCWGCWQSAHRASEQDLPEHPAVEWGMRHRGTRGQVTVRVTCPICEQPRWLELKSVLKQVRGGDFRGTCLRDRFVGRPKSGEWPPAPGVDWDTMKFMYEGERRRAMVLVTCGECGRERWCQPSHTAAAIRRGTFRAECLTHRPPMRVSIDRRERIWEAIWLFGGGLGRPAGHPAREAKAAAP